MKIRAAFGRLCSREPSSLVCLKAMKHDHGSTDKHGTQSTGARGGGNGHVHGPGAHSHTPSGPGAERRLLWATVLTGGFMVVEVVGGVVSGSLALLADAGHMLTDVGALVLAYAGIRLGRRTGDGQRSYGYARLEVLAAFVNGITLLALSAWILVEAVLRFLEPVEVLSGTMLVIALLGLGINVASFLILQGGADNLNIRGALVHVLGDLLGSVAAIAAALVIWFTAWMPADPLLSALVALLIIRSGWDITRRSGHILLEGSPDELKREEIEAALEVIPGVEKAHHIHLWSLTSGRPLATLHLRLKPGADFQSVMSMAKGALSDRFKIEHSTIEVESSERIAGRELAGSECGQSGPHLQ